MRLGLIVAAMLGVGAVLAASLLLLDGEAAAPSARIVARGSPEDQRQPDEIWDATTDSLTTAPEPIAELIETAPLPPAGDLGEPPSDPPNLIGQVVDEDARPIVGARVGLLPSASWLDLQRQRHRADHPDEPLPLPSFAAEVSTVKEGRFSLNTEGLRSSPWGGDGEHTTLQLTVSAAGYGTVLHSVEWFGDQVTVVPPIALPRELLITGRVVDGVGRPLTGVSVRPLLWTPLEGQAWAELADSARQLLPRLLSVPSDERGFFELPGLPVGDGWLGLWIEGALPVVSELLELSNELNVVDVGELVLPLGSIISGHVRKGDGKGLSGVQVVASSSPTRRSSTGTTHGEFLWMANRRQESVVLTDRAGAFTLDGLNHPQYRIYAGAAGWQTELADRVQPGIVDLEFVLGHASPLKLQVVDSAGELWPESQLPGLAPLEGPIPKATVRPDAVILFGRGKRQLPLTVTRGERLGGWFVKGLAKEDLQLEVTVPGYTSWSGAPSRLPKFDGVSYVLLSREGVLEGLVQAGADGRPVLGAAVALRSSAGGGALQETFTNAAGTFEFSGLSVGSYYASARRRGFESTDSEVKTFDLPGQWREVEIPMRAGGDVRGRVQSRGGMAAPGRVVTETPGGRTARTDGQGRFLLADLPLGQHTLQADQGLGVGVHVRQGSTAEVVLEVSTSAVVQGRVSSYGRSAPGCTVSLVTKTGKLVESVTSDATGGFSLRTFALGRMTLSATSPAGVPSDSVEVELTPGLSLYLDLFFTAASVSGRVADAISGRAIAGAVVTVAASTEEVAATTDSLGQFQLDLLPGGALLLRCEHALFQPGSLQIESLGADEQRQQLQLSLKRRAPPATLQGRALFKKGDPCFDGTVLYAMPPESLWKLSSWQRRWRADEDASLDAEIRTTTKNGRYAFEGLKPGHYTIIQELWLLDPATREWANRTHWLKAVELVSGEVLEVDVEVQEG